MARLVALGVIAVGWATRTLAEQADAASAALPSGAVPFPPPRPGAAVTEVDRRVEVWIDLAMPPMQAMTSLTAEQRVAYGHAIDAQQSALIERLQPWSALERGRVRIVRNAVVVEVPESALEEIRRLPGVARVQKVTHPHRINTPGPASS